MNLTVTATYQAVTLHVTDQPVALSLDAAKLLLANLQNAIVSATYHPHAAYIPATVHAVTALLASTPGISAVASECVANNYRIAFVYHDRAFQLYWDTALGQFTLCREMTAGYQIDLERLGVEWDLWEYITPTSIPAGAARFVATLLDFLVGEAAIFPGPAPEYPDVLTKPLHRALYDYLRDATTVLRLIAAIDAVRKDGWRGNVVKEREIKQAIYRTTGYAANQVQAVFEVYQAYAA